MQGTLSKIQIMSEQAAKWLQRQQFGESRSPVNTKALKRREVVCLPLMRKFMSFVRPSLLTASSLVQAQNLALNSVDRVLQQGQRDPV